MSGDKDREFYLKVSDVSEADVKKFCASCGNVGEDGICKLKDGIIYQPKFVAQGWCGWASVNGQRGMMTKHGFVNTSVIPEPSK